MEPETINIVSHWLQHDLLTRVEHLSTILQGAQGWHPIAMVRMEAIPHSAVRPDMARQAIRCPFWRDNRTTNSAVEILARAKVRMKRRSAAYVVCVKLVRSHLRYVSDLPQRLH